MNPKEDHVMWSGLVESKIRILLGLFERNPGVQLVHVNPQQFIPIDIEEGSYQTMWCMGLELNKGEAAVKKIDLTDDIQGFTNTVTRQSMHNNIYHEGMLVEAKYVKRKELAGYIPKETLNRGRTISQKKKTLQHQQSTDSLTSESLAPEANGNPSGSSQVPGLADSTSALYSVAGITSSDTASSPLKRPHSPPGPSSSLHPCDPEGKAHGDEFDGDLGELHDAVSPPDDQMTPRTAAGKGSPDADRSMESIDPREPLDPSEPMDLQNAATTDCLTVPPTQRGTSLLGTSSGGVLAARNPPVDGVSKGISLASQASRIASDRDES